MRLKMNFSPGMMRGKADKLLITLFFSVLFFNPIFSQEIRIPDALFTRPEKTNYEETSLHRDVMDFVITLCEGSKLATFEIIGSSKEGRKIPLVIMADPPVATPREAKNSGKPIIYIQGNIHAGEVEGKEASMELMREIAFGTKRELLSNQILLFGPIYNADGNDSLGLNNRRSQAGSPKMAGIRYSGEGYDLNRDGLKAEALETKAMLKNVMLRWDPMLFIDLHTTNGSWHGYSLTYAPGNLTAGHPGTTNYLMDTLFPSVTQTVKDRSGLDMYLYGNFRDYPPEIFSPTPYMPRFLTNSMALKNKYSILVETFAHDRFEKRILSSKMFIQSVLEFTNLRGGEMMTNLERSVKETIAEIQQNAGDMKKGVSFRAEQLGEPTDLLVYEMEEYTNDEGKKRMQKTGKRVWIPGVKIMHRFEPVILSTVPRGYLFPPELSNVAEKLQEHGVLVEQLDRATTFKGEEFIITGYKKAEREYQKHNLVTMEGEFQDAVRKMPKGSYFVDLAQPMAYLVFYMLEPEADDGLVVWNFFDNYLEKRGISNKKVAYPVFKWYSKVD